MSQALRFQRERRGWSRATLAEILGTTSTLVTQWEEGSSVPPATLHSKLCTLLGLDERTLQDTSPSDAGNTPPTFLLLPHTTPRLTTISGDPSQKKSHAVLDPFLSPPLKGVNNLIGRSSLLRQLKQHLLLQHSLALSGLPGVGKTALAVALAYDPEVRAQFSDGVLWAGLGLQPHIPGIFRRWGNLLGAIIHDKETRGDEASWQHILHSTIAQKHLLIILDDAWQTEVVDALQIGNANCAYLLTTRLAHVASHLAGDQIVQVPELEEHDGVELLTQFAPEILHCESDLAQSLTRAVGAHPLALTLMSKYLGSNAAMKQPRRLHAALTHLLDAEQRLRLYTPRPASDQVSNQSMELDISIKSVIEISYLHLPETAQQALLSLSILPVKPARLTQGTIFAVTNVAQEVINILCDAELLERTSDTYYMVHPLIADYIRAQGPAPEAAQRLIKYGVHFIEAHHADAAALEHESPTLFAALECAWKAEQWMDLVQGCHLIIPFLFIWGWYTLIEKLLEKALFAAIKSDNIFYRICMLEHLSTLAHLQGNYSLAQNLALQALDMARTAEILEKIVSLHAQLGESAHQMGNYTQAEGYYQQGLLLARQHNNQQQISILLKNLGVLAKNRGNYAVAQVHYQEGLAIARELNHPDLISQLLMNMGVIATERGNYTQAEAYYQEGLSLTRQLGHRERICVLLSNLGVLADAQGNYTQAEELLQEGLTLARQLGHRERMSLLLLNLGVVSNRQGKDEKAKAFYQEGLTLARQIEHSERISLFLLNLGDLAVEQGEITQAQSYLQEGLLLARQLEHRKRISDLLQHLGTLATRQNEFFQAEIYLREGMALAHQLGHPQLVCQHLSAWGELHLRQQHIEVAESAFLEMLQLAPTGDQAIVAHAQFGLASVAASRHQLDMARSLAKHSYDIFELLGHREKQLVLAFLEKIEQASPQP